MSATPHLHLVQNPTELTREEALKKRLSELLAKATPRRLTRHNRGRYARTVKHVNGHIKRGVIKRRSGRL